MIALRGVKISTQRQWLRLQAALAYAEQTCGGHLLNRVLEVRSMTCLYSPRFHAEHAPTLTYGLP